MQGFIKRMIEEHKALNEKCVKLMTYLEGTKNAKVKAEDMLYFINNTTLLKIQLEHMTNYLNTLSDRLALHGITVVLNSDKKTFSYYTEVSDTEDNGK